jgi:hypothetical protein
VSERREKRRRLRERRRVREALLLDLGALVYELHRQGKRAPDLLQRKAAQLTVVDEEVRRLQSELEGMEAPADLAEETAEVDAVSDEGALPDEDGDDAQAEDAEWHAAQSEDDELEDHEPEEDEEVEQATDEHEAAVSEHEEPLR